MLIACLESVIGLHWNRCPRCVESAVRVANRPHSRQHRQVLQVPSQHGHVLEIRTSYGVLENADVRIEDLRSGYRYCAPRFASRHCNEGCGAIRSGLKLADDVTGRQAEAAPDREARAQDVAVDVVRPSGVGLAHEYRTDHLAGDEHRSSLFALTTGIQSACGLCQTASFSVGQ